MPALSAPAPCSARPPLARPLPCVDRTVGERSLIVPRGLLAQLTVTTNRSDCAPLPCVDRTIGERNLIAPWGLLAQLMELTTYCSDCAPAHAPCSAIYALHLSHPILSSHGA